MVWRTDVFFEAFKRVGMLMHALYWDDSLFAPVDLDVDLNSPSEDVLDAVRDVDFMVEYERKAAVQPAIGGLMIIDGFMYRVRENPRQKDNGDFLMADLMRLGRVRAGFNPAQTPWLTDTSVLVDALPVGPQ